MAAPMRSGHPQQDGQGHRARVADSCKGATAARGPQQPSAGQPQQHQTNQPPATTANFEYDDNEWDIAGIGDLIIDLDADIEKTNEQQQPISNVSSNMATNNGGGPQASKTAATAKMHIEHSATTDKGLKMKIKRTKPGSKSSEAKHEIVKSNEQNGVVDASELPKGPQNGPSGNKHAPSNAQAQSGGSNVLSGNSSQNSTASNSNNANNASKRGSSGHRRDKASRDKHSDRNVHNSVSTSSSNTNSQSASASALNTSVTSGSSDKTANKSSSSLSGASGSIAQNPTLMGNVAISSSNEMNGLLRPASTPQTCPPRSVFPASTGPGPPPPSPGPPASPAAATGSASKPEQSKVGGGVSSGVPNNSANNGAAVVSASVGHSAHSGQDEHRTNSTSPPPNKKARFSEPKETVDVCVGTSVGTITEPDCLGPCEPGTSVTLEGIVWHETEGGVLVVNVTWRGKTYVGTLLDCTRHDWAPPRFCDSPTSDLDNRTPKGRETRSSVHSKLRNGGGVKGGRRGVANGAGPANAPSSPTPFIPPRPDNKRKGRSGEDEAAPATGKKAKVVVPSTPTPIVVTPAPCGSPPPSPVFLECPEPNCSKKYRHINGLKYHQSHAHGSVATDDDDTKDVTSMSENDESNIEAPSPVTPVKSPEKSQDSPSTPIKKDSNSSEAPSLMSNTESTSTPPSPATPPSVHELPQSVAVSPPSVSLSEPPTSKPQAAVKPAILRFGTTTGSEDYSNTTTAGSIGSFGKPQVQGSPVTNSNPLISGRSSVPGTPTSEQVQSESPSPQSFANQLQSHVNMSPQQFSQPPNIMIPNQNTSTSQIQSQMSPHHPPPSPSQIAKVPQFKVKPTSALMPDEKKPQQMPQPGHPQHSTNVQKPQNYKKKNRKSPGDSPHLSPTDPLVFGMEQSGRDEVQSPSYAYSDISDDGAPVTMDGEVEKNKNPDKKTESGQALPHMGQYGIFPYFSQAHQYVVPNQQQPQQLDTSNKQKEPEKQPEKAQIEKDIKKEGSDYQSKLMQQHYFPTAYSYLPPGYPYNMDPGYGGLAVPQEEKHKEDRGKENPSPIEQPIKQPSSLPSTPKPQKQSELMKDKHQNDNHQIIKESIEIKNQMNPYMYSRQSAQPSPQQQSPLSHHQHRDRERDREEEARRYYVYEQSRRKEHQHHASQQHQRESDHKQSSLNKMQMSQNSSMKVKEVKIEEKKEKEIKQEGVKPTMETQGPPPPPTSQYAYIHPHSYMQGHYGALPFDPNHPMYRGIMVPGPYGSGPYLHPQMPRYHAPEDLSRAPPPTKALDVLQHHAQYYSSHKIHELQERALKSPTPKTSVASSSPSTNNAPSSGGPSPAQISAPSTTQATSTTPSNGKQTPTDNKDSRSPPPQRHVHTHHHTHVGLGYPIYGAGPYGAAVLASQQAAAVTVINPYPTK